MPSGAQGRAGNNDDLNGEHTFKRFNPMGRPHLPFTRICRPMAAIPKPTARRRLRSSPAAILLLLAFWRIPGFRSGPQSKWSPYLGGRVAPAISPVRLSASKVVGSLGVFRTLNTNDIIKTSPATSPGAASFRCRGIRCARHRGQISYRNAAAVPVCQLRLCRCPHSAMICFLNSPNIPEADAKCDIQVRSGDHLPAVPATPREGRWRLLAHQCVEARRRSLIASDQFFPSATRETTIRSCPAMP